MNSMSSSLHTDLPSEVWELILDKLTNSDLWAIRSLNRVAYASAARVRYGALWIVPHRENYLTTAMKRLCENRLQIIGLVHTFHIHSHIEVREFANQSQEKRKFHLPKTRHSLIHKILASPDLNIKKLTLHFDAVVLPYVLLAWTKTARYLTHLELQFWTDSISNALLSLDPGFLCPSLSTFILSYGDNGAHVPQAQIHPSQGLQSLGLHQLDDTASNWILPPSFPGLNQFPLLQKLHISGMSLTHNPSLVRFIIARTPSLRDLALMRLSDAPIRVLHYLPATDELQTLSMSLDSAHDVLRADILQSTHSSSLIHRYSHLRRLDITLSTSNYTNGTILFVLLMELGRGCSLLEELRVQSLYTLAFRHFRAALLLLPRLVQLTSSGTRYCEYLMCELSAYPELWNRSNTRTYHFFDLGQVRQCLGRDLRREMTVELQKDVKSAYKDLIADGQAWDTLHASTKKALKEGYLKGESATIASQVIHSDVKVDHRVVVLQLMESHVRLDNQNPQ
ncbi:hypothetical protein DL96DRAFT_1759159 [Flagelloscypha sp. PMI_526]|nr:hypothetical protein DL96DRAFT_1759159 [Flagelloscypha sp. PMI_526]